jgi:hypothetical protein
MDSNPFVTAARALSSQTPAVDATPSATPAPSDSSAPNPFVAAAHVHAAATNPFVDAAHAHAAMTNPFVAAAHIHKAATAATSTRPGVPKFEQPKDARTNPLRDASDFLEMGFAVPNAYLRQEHKLTDDIAGHGDYTDLRKILDLIKQGKIHEAVDEYGVGSTPQLKHEAEFTDKANRADGGLFGLKPNLAQTELDHPVVRGLVTGAEEFANPANLLTGEVAGQGLRYAGLGVKAARAASPVLEDSLTALEQAGASAAKPIVQAAGAVARPIGKALAPIANVAGKVNAAAQGVTRKATEPVAKILNSFFSKYGDVENAAGAQVADVARSINKRPAVVQKDVERLTGQVFGKELTREQKLEVVRRSYVDERNNRLYTGNPNIAEPKTGLSLNDRADLYRGAYNRITPLLQRFGLLNDQTYKTGLYDPRQVFKGRPVYATEEMPEDTPFVPTRAMQAAETGFGGGPLSIRKANRGHKTVGPLNEVPDSVLHPDFDPAHQFYEDLLQKHTSLSNEIGRGRLERAYPIDSAGKPLITDPQFGQPVAARTPAKYANDETGEFFGYGAEGKAALDKHLKTLSDQRATQAAAGDFTVQRDAKALELTPEQIGSARGLNARISGVKRQITEAAKASNVAGKLADYVSSRYAVQRDRIGSELFTAATRQANRVDSLNAAIEKAQGKVTQGAGQARAAQLAAMVDERNREAQRLAGIVERVERAASPLGQTAKSGYERVFPMIDALPTQLAAKVRPLIEDAGKVPNAQTLAAARGMLKSANGPEAKALDTELERLATRTTTGKLDVLQDENLSGKGVKRLGTIARAAQAAPGKAADAATSGALRSQAQSMARAANAGVDQTGQRIIGDMHREAQKAEQEASRTWDDIYAKRDKLAHPSEDAMYAAQGKAQTARIRAMMLGEKKGTLEELAAARENYDRVYQQHFDQMLVQLGREYGETAQAPRGYVKEASGSPTAPEKYLQPDVAEFLDPAGKSGKAVGAFKAVSEALAKINALSRAGIVLLPVAHAGPNLGIAFIATGGTPQRMAQILSTQAKFAPELVARAERAGATSEATRVMFGSESAHQAFTPTAELAQEAAAKASAKFGPIGGKIAAAGTHVRDAADNVYGGMNRWLFDKVERGYRLDYFDRLTKDGTSDGAAARAVDSAFGKVGDISPNERFLTRIFYFYPWMKTVVPFWIKHGLVQPQYWDAPVRGTMVNNQAQGYDDPSRPFTATLGKRADGEWRRYKEFVPQSVTEMVAEAGRAPFDAAFGSKTDALADLYAPINYAQGHLNTLISLFKDVSEAAFAYKFGRQPPPFNVAYVDPTKTGAAQNLEMASNIAGRFVSPYQQIGRAVADPAIAPSIVTGGFSYGVPTAAQTLRRTAVDRRFGPAIAAAKKRHDSPGLATLYAERARALQPPQPQPTGLGALYSTPR